MENNTTGRKDTGVEMGLDSTGSKYFPMAGFYEHGTKFELIKAGHFLTSLATKNSVPSSKCKSVGCLSDV